jgi:hypothetical protein
MSATAKIYDGRVWVELDGQITQGLAEMLATAGGSPVPAVRDGDKWYFYDEGEYMIRLEEES